MAEGPESGQVCCDDAWEQAYRQFETPEQEVAKFVRRLRAAGVENWPAESRIAELFCGRGGGLTALQKLGFTELVGVDLSGRLLEEYRGPAATHVADCRQLPLADGSLDTVVVQGGLHHLERIPHDLDAVLDEICRVLSPGGRMLVVEPWRTPFLRLVHAMCKTPPLRACWPKLAALDTMIQHERVTYDNWLGQPHVILRSIEQRFEIRQQRIGWGKLLLEGICKPHVSD